MSDMDTEEELIELYTKIGQWKDRITKEISSACAYFFKDTLKILDEMKEVLEDE